jgi:hypothetical protein
MTTEPSSQAIDPSPKGAEPPHPSSPRLVAATVGWFVGWPVLFACLPLVTLGDALEACLVVVGNLFWFASCYGLYRLLFAMADAHRPAATTVRKFLIGWFCGWFPLFIVCGHLASLIEHPYWFDLSIIIPGTILWFASCYSIYDMLFTIAEAHWPEAKSIREIMRSLFRILLSPHHSS